MPNNAKNLPEGDINCQKGPKSEEEEKVQKREDFIVLVLLHVERFRFCRKRDFFNKQLIIAEQFQAQIY